MGLQDGPLQISIVARYLKSTYQKTEHLLASRHYNLTNHPYYLTVVGLVLMLYDHALLLPAEVAFVWKAPSSFSRNGFLLNKYLAIVCLLVDAYRTPQLPHYLSCAELVLCFRRIVPVSNASGSSASSNSVCTIISVSHD